MTSSKAGSYLLLLYLLAGLSAPAVHAEAEAAEEALTELGVAPAAARQLIERWQALAAAPSVDSLVQAMTDVVQRRRAPVDLVVDKVEEGLAKQVPPRRLLSALDPWGRELSQSSEVALRLHRRFDPGSVTLRETVLRIQLLRRGGDADAWLRELFLSARDGDADVGTFLRVSEAAAQLRDRGLQEALANRAGQRWLTAGIRAGDVDDFLRAIDEVARDTTLAAAAEWVTDRVVRGWSASTVAEQIIHGPTWEVREQTEGTDVSGEDGVAEGGREGTKADRDNEENTDDNE